ncbi:hypothetical protein F3Y22_tig00110258pilonHSYRG00044 [Hibiscus syriacus]|uniref:RNase H type-1 domain-containing protein n=1 Tax=Hibiscus syriacus TaxID=106335 RepID=A0A6A3B9W8_HIBSY|nr:hypothetical protein F3Y22_tig00110258pilonHSYRG00044 [Hibiscus syriacus]
MDAELWGIIEDLGIAWELGLPNVILEIDNKEVCTLVQHGLCMDLHSRLQIMAPAADLQWLYHRKCDEDDLPVPPSPREDKEDSWSDAMSTWQIDLTGNASGLVAGLCISVE